MIRSIISCTIAILIGVTAQTSFAADDWPTGPLMANGGNAATGYVPIGQIANAYEICGIFSHPFFTEPGSALDFDELNSVSSNFQWEGIEASYLWVQRKLYEAGVDPRGLGYGINLDEQTAAIADYNITACLKYLKDELPEFYGLLKSRFLHYLKDECLEQQFRIAKSVDDNGNIVEQRIPLEKVSCIDFSYNGRRYSDWNSTTFSLMLVWKEAHPVLAKVFDSGRAEMQVRLAQRDERVAQERIEQAEAEAEQQQREDAFNKRKQLWAEYSSRQKSLLEQVYNFSSTGDPEGRSYEFWIEVDSCVLTNGKATLDNRDINMTAFRIYPDWSVNNEAIIVSSDGEFYLATASNISIERVQRAWGLAFDECPGKTSAF